MLNSDSDGNHAQAQLIKDGTEAEFMVDVIEASQDQPVIVDFWAPWCGPCKQLGPALEEAVNAARGAVRMVKINVDENQQIAAQLRIQSIPTVYAFYQGQPVDGFQGAQTPSQLKEFVQKLASLAGEDGFADALASAEELLANGALADAVEIYSAILSEDPNNQEALLGLIKTHLAAGNIDQAESLIQTAPEPDHPSFDGVKAQIELARASEGAGELGELQAKLEANPADHAVRFDLALALLANQKTEEAIHELLEIFKRDREWNEGAAKDQLIKIFDSLGPKDELAQKGRRKLSSLIFA